MFTQTYGNPAYNMTPFTIFNFQGKKPIQNMFNSWHNFKLPLPLPSYFQMRIRRSVSGYIGVNKVYVQVLEVILIHT